MGGARAAPRREIAALLGWGQVGAAASREPAVVRLQGAWLPAGARTLLAASTGPGRVQCVGA